jgi:hypothetical protein
MDDSEVVTFGLQSADKEAVEDTLQESELESARMENIIVISVININCYSCGTF